MGSCHPQFGSGLGVRAVCAMRTQAEASYVRCRRRAQDSYAAHVAGSCAATRRSDLAHYRDDEFLQDAVQQTLAYVQQELPAIHNPWQPTLEVRACAKETSTCHESAHTHSRAQHAVGTSDPWLQVTLGYK